jgi:hypothetical protein
MGTVAHLAMLSKPSRDYPPATVDRMTRVQGPPIQTDIGGETARLDEPLGTVVATLAQALERAEPEFVDVAVMRLDVVADFRRRDDSALQAERAQRMFAQLVPPDSSPASGGVPLIPFRRLAANAHGSTLSSASRCTKHRAGGT